MKILSNNIIRWMNATITLNHSIHCRCRESVTCYVNYAIGCNYNVVWWLKYLLPFLPISCSTANNSNSARWNGLRDFIKIIVSLVAIHCSHGILIMCTRFFSLFIISAFFIEDCWAKNSWRMKRNEEKYALDKSFFSQEAVASGRFSIGLLQNYSSHFRINYICPSKMSEWRAKTFVFLIR